MENVNRRQWIDGKLAAPVEEETRFYTVDKTQFFEETIGEHDISKYKKGMQEIIARYEIRNKRILCIGPGQCWYEYWFTNDHNQILFVDIDEKEIIEPMLQKLQKSTKASDDSIHYAISDVRNLGDYLSEPFDVILSFGFTPDEFYRGEVQKNKPKDTNFNWELYKQTFSDLILTLTKQLPANGLLLSLSYCGGPDTTSPTYLNSVKSTCADNELTLLEVTSVQECPGINLVVAKKGSNLGQWSDRALPTLSAIHPRADYKPYSIPVYSVYPCEDFTPFGKTEEIVNSIVSKNFKDIKSCLYDGKHSQEVRAMLLSQINVTSLESTNSEAPFKIFPNSGDFQTSTLDNISSNEQFDLLWMSSYKRDDKYRTTTSHMYSGPISKEANVVFSPETHQVFQKINTKHLVVYGQAGLDVSNSPGFTNQLRKELGRHNLKLSKLYVLEIAPNVFIASATSNTATDKTSFVIEEFYPDAENPKAVEIDLNSQGMSLFFRKKWNAVKRKLRTFVS